MARPSPVPADPAADAAMLLRRLGFAILMIVLPVAALFARRALVVLAPVGIALLVIAAALDGTARPLRQGTARLAFSSGGIAGGILILWCGLSLIWTPFKAEAAERLFNIVGTLAMAVAGYLALPDRMRSANLYLLPIGIGAATLAAAWLGIAALQRGLPDDAATQNFERGLVVAVLLVWPSLAWLRSRERDLEALLLAVAVAVAVVLAPFPLPLAGLVVGAIAFALTSAHPRLGVRVSAILMAALLVLAPILPFLVRPAAALLLGAGDPIIGILEVWRSVVLDEPARLVTGHGFETALRGRSVGLLPENAPRTLLFEVWYDLGLVGAISGAVALYLAVMAAGRDHPPLVPGVMASFASAFTLACLGIGTAQMWWFTALVVTVLIFTAAERGQFRTTRPKAIILRGRTPPGSATG
jgi:hypothetical protein